MLIKCPECNLQVSDKAVVCPHCGCPQKSDKSFIPSRSTKHRRLPNGFGQITEIKDKNLRNRFRVMITTAKTAEGKPICKLLKPKAYFPTYNEAYKALVEYNRDPYNLDEIITLKELYEKWSKEAFSNCSVGYVRNLKAAWNYCMPLYDVPVRNIKVGDLKNCIENANRTIDGQVVEASTATKNRMKVLLNRLLDYAEEYELIEKNRSRSFSLSSEILQQLSNDDSGHIIFDEQELKILWDHMETSSYVGYILYQCYSGWRPTELCDITLSNVHLEEGYIIGGSKTEAGKNRIVPIHPKVKSIVEKEYNRAKTLKSEYLFNWLGKDRIGDPKLSYARYNFLFSGIISELKLNPEHRPHDARKTFVTMAKKYKLDEYAIKRIVGHTINDITEAIYTERDLDWYIEEMQKIK